METITEKEIEFLLFVNASEESYLKEITLDFERWDCDKSLVVEKLSYLIRQELFGLGELTSQDFLDMEKDKALETITTWEFVQSSKLILFLTDNGWERWNSDTYDWEITPERERHLVFSNKHRFKS
ncbi:MAG: hypothetical protein MUF28_04895 [Ignavibacterium sp.]|jgi:hypothetical protein|nr:hypothetical protein [Ignavibacterium sp.]